MRLLLFAIALSITSGLQADTLHIADLVHTDVYVYEVPVIADSVMTDYEQFGNYYIGQLRRSVSSSYYIAVSDSFTIIIPIEYNVVIVTQRCEPGDINCDGSIDISDLWALIDYMFLGGSL